MRIEGEWLPGPSGVLRPILRAAVVAPSALEAATFLVDSGATRTVLSKRTADALGLSLAGLPSWSAEGIGGVAECVLLPLRLGLIRETGDVVSVEGPFHVFVSADSGNDDILGNDVLNNFDVILSYRRREVVLLAPPHGYAVTG